MKSTPRQNAGIDMALYDRYRPESNLRVELGVRSGALLVASIGLSCSARPDMFVRIAKHVVSEQPNTCFIWMGDEHSRRTAKQLSELVGIGANVFVLPYTADARPVLSQVNVFLLTAPDAIFGFVICEAMALGVPVIAALAVGGEEVVVPGRTGYLIPVEDEVMFASAVRMLLNDPRLCSRLGKTARQRAGERFDLSRMHTELERLFIASSATT